MRVGGGQAKQQVFSESVVFLQQKIIIDVT